MPPALRGRLWPLFPLLALHVRDTSLRSVALLPESPRAAGWVNHRYIPQLGDCSPEVARLFCEPPTLELRLPLARPAVLRAGGRGATCSLSSPSLGAPWRSCSLGKKTGGQNLRLEASAPSSQSGGDCLSAPHGASLGAPTGEGWEGTGWARAPSSLHPSGESSDPGPSFPAQQNHTQPSPGLPSSAPAGAAF